MYSEDYDGANAQERSGEDVFSKPVRAGKRTYFFDVKATKGNDYYLTITESKRKVDAKSAVKANAPVSKSVSKAIPALGEAPVPMARPEYTMTSLDPAKMPVRKQLVLKNKIDPSEEAFHERATAAVKAYYGIK